MLTQQTIDKLHAMRLRGLAEAFQQQLEQPGIHELSFEERLGLLIDRQWDWRQDRALQRRLRNARLQGNACVEDIDYRTGGPARYVRVKETGGRLGFITPLTHNFCESCNRVRITCTGTLYMCLGQNDAADLRSPLRASESDAQLYAAIDEAIGRKPKGHDFVIDREHQRPAVARHMSVTGG